VDSFNWIWLVVVIVAVVWGQLRKLGSNVRAMQASQQARLAAMQAAADAAAAGAPPPAAAYAPASPPPGAAPAPPRRPLPSLASVQPAPPPTPGPGIPVSSTRAFLRGAFADPAHARHAVILAEVLSKPNALR
jgi:hypothetical protein